MSGEFVLTLLIVRTLVTYKCVVASEEASIQDEIVDKYKELCPFTNLCLTHERSSAYTKKCCKECSCDENCGQNCCPDKTGLEFKLQHTLQVCTTAQYRRHAPLKLRGKSYIMTSTCPNDYNNKTVKHSCAKEYFDFNILDEMENLPPVTGKTSNVIYKNSICALCNGEQEDNLIYWETRFVCEDDPILFPSSTTMIFNIINDEIDENDTNCNLIFDPPTNTGYYSTCIKGLIERCNVTGDWITYNATIEKACNSYTSVYDDIYRNVHCFLCNGFSEIDVNFTCVEIGDGYEAPSFIVLLDFNQLDKKNYQNNQELCPAETVYDSIKGKCLPLHCGHGFNLAGNKCVPLFASILINTEVSRVVYGITLTFVPKEWSSPRMLHFKALRQDILQVTNNIDQGRNITIIDSFIKIRKSIRRLIADMYVSNRSLMIPVSDIEFIALKVLISETTASDVSDRIRQVKDSLNFNFSDYTVIWRKIIGSKFFNWRYVSLRTSEELDMLFAIEIPFFLYLSFESAYDEYGKGILPFFEKVTALIAEPSETFELDPDPFCPKVELSMSEYTISQSQGDVFINRADKSIATETIVMSENGSTIYVCSKDFISMIGKQEKDIAFIHTPLSILSIVLNSVSVLALVVTLTIYSVFSSLRSIPGLNNMGLVISLISVFSFSLVNTCVDISTVWLCRLVGISLHFSLLSSFCWMFVCTLHMVRVFSMISEKSVRESKIKQFVLYVAFSEICSASIVIATVIAGQVLSDGDHIGYTDDPCYTDPDMMVYNVAIPVGAVIVLNFGMFLYVVYIISRLPDMRKNSSHERQNITIFIKLSTLTGLTWIFTFVYQFTGIDAFAYVSTIANASQGLFIMISFVVNKRIYKMIEQKHSNITSSLQSRKVSNIGNISSKIDGHGI